MVLYVAGVAGTITGAGVDAEGDAEGDAGSAGGCGAHSDDGVGSERNAIQNEPTACPKNCCSSTTMG